MEAVTIIVKVWNALDHVRLCLETLLHNTDKPFRLIVVDNGSRPDVLHFLIQLTQVYPEVLLICNPINVGPAVATCQAFSCVETDLVCLIDSDVLVPRNWLAPLVSDFRRLPGLGMLAPMKYHETLAYPFVADEIQDSREAWFNVKRLYPHLLPLEQFHKYSRGQSIEEFGRAMRQTNPVGVQVMEAPPAFFSTCCVLVDVHAAKAVGGIADPRFVGYGSEDIDLCWRLGQGGKVIAKSPSVYVHHFHNSSMNDNGVDVNAALRQANLVLYRKWKATLLDIVRREIAKGVVLGDYLSRHFIFGPLARNTTFLADLRLAIGETEDQGGCGQIIENGSLHRRQPQATCQGYSSSW